MIEYIERKLLTTDTCKPMIGRKVTEVYEALKRPIELNHDRYGWV
jgi:hypothetical protein